MRLKAGPGDWEGETINVVMVCTLWHKVVYSRYRGGETSGQAGRPNKQNTSFDGSIRLVKGNNAKRNRKKSKKATIIDGGQ